MPQQTQSVLIPRNRFSLSTAKDWLVKNNYKLKKVDITSNFFRFRQVAPSQIGNYYMKNLDNGVKLVIGERK